MKAYSILFIFALTLSMFSSCTSTSDNTQGDKTLKLETRSGNASLESFVTGKWKDNNSDRWVNLKIDGTFEAIFEEGHLISGKWELSEDKKHLKLVEDKGVEGKGRSFVQDFKVLELSDSVMKVEDGDGNVLEFASI